MGMRTPGTYFNFTIASMGNWIEYEKPLGDLIKPYIVPFIPHRIPAVSWNKSEVSWTAGTSFAGILLKVEVWP